MTDVTITFPDGKTKQVPTGTTGLDVACVERVRPMPFFTTLAGPPP